MYTLGEGKLLGDRRTIAADQLIEDDSQRPDIDFGGEERVACEGLRRKVAETAHALRGQGHFGVLRVECFANAEVQHFGSASVEHDVLRFEVVVHDSLGGEVADHRKQLLHDCPGLWLGNKLLLVEQLG